MEEAYKTVALPATCPGIGYTFKHRNAVEALIKHYCRKAIGKRDGNGVLFTQEDYLVMCNRGKCHDMDKLLMSLSYPQLTSDYFHRMFNGHHAEGLIEINMKSKYDWIEMIMDWESAAYTKPDKGKSAYEVATEWYSELLPYLTPYLKLFGFVSAERTLIAEIKNKVSGVVYETDLVDAIIGYMHTTHLHLLEYISRLDDAGYMQAYNKPTPYRHKITQRQNGTIHTRPNAYVMTHRSTAAREMIQGKWEAQIFNMDAVCSIKVGDIPNLNAQAKNVYMQLNSNRLQR